MRQLYKPLRCKQTQNMEGSGYCKQHHQSNAINKTAKVMLM